MRVHLISARLKKKLQNANEQSLLFWTSNKKLMTNIVYPKVMKAILKTLLALICFKQIPLN